MRVLDADPSISYKMGKNKKHRIRKAKENEADESSDDGLQIGCPHVTKAVNVAAMRKAIMKPTVTIGECSGCSKEAVKSTSRDLFGGVIEGPPAAEGEDAEPLETTVCVCLHCGHQGCDRNSLNKHALKHYKTPHSGIHSIIVNLTTWSTWCYACDDEVPVNGRIQSCISLLQKESGVTKSEPVQSIAGPLDSPVNESLHSMVNSSASKNTAPISCVKVKGLSNLGNTCFFNAVMQSMCQTKGLETLLGERSKPGKMFTIPGPEPSLETDSSSSEEEREEEPTEKMKPLPSIQAAYGDPGPITLALLGFLQEMKGGTTRNGTVNPTALFTQVCKKAPRFKGYQQQDSHELLRYLIDCIRTEEIKRGQASILKFFRLPETISPKKVDEDTKLKVKEYGRQVKHTFLDTLFGGQLVSTVKCEECKAVSQVFEAFLDLSLPVMEEKPQRPNLVLIGKKKDSVSVADEDVGAVAAASAMGLEGLADKPSKYQERKNKRMARKEAKKKSKLHKSKSVEQNDSGEKDDQEEKPCNDEGVDKEEKNRNENENSTVDKEKEKEATGPSSQACEEQQELEVTRRDSNRSTTAVDSSPEGSKDGLEANEEEERSDPSDADVEDNVESDMSRVANSNSHSYPTSICSSSQSSASQPKSHSSSEEKGVAACTTSVCSSMDTPTSLFKDQQLLDSSIDSNLSLMESSSVFTTTNTSMLGLESSGGGGRFQADVDVTLNGQTTVTNGNIDNGAVDKLCSEVNQIDISDSNGARLSYEVTVNNSQVIQLANGVGRLTVSDDESESVKHNTANQQPNSATVETKSEPTTEITNPKSLEDPPEVSATFDISLPSSTKSIGTPSHIEGVHHLSGSSQPDHKPGSNEKGDEADTAVQVIQVEDKQHAYQNILKTHQKYLKDAKNFSMNTLAPRYHPSPKECSILSCLNQFTAAELLTGSNKVGCKECTRRRRTNSHSHKAEKKGKDTVYSNANKQYLIFRPPAVLTLHLKRFEQTGLTSRKVNRHVDFPVLLDLAPYCSSLCLGVKEGQSKVLYSLYGVVEHSGRLSGGHYTAYIKVRPGLASHTQFTHSHPPSPQDLLKVYLARIMKVKSGSPAWHDSFNDKSEGGEVVDKEVESRAETLAPPGRWFHISDSRVNEVTEAVVLKAQAYLLFYERIF